MNKLAPSHIMVNSGHGEYYLVILCFDGNFYLILGCCASDYPRNSEVDYHINTVLKIQLNFFCTFLQKSWSIFCEILQYVLQDHNYGAPPPPTPSSPPKPIVNGVSTANGLARSLPPVNQQAPSTNFITNRSTKNVQQPSTPSIFSSSKSSMIIPSISCSLF